MAVYSRECVKIPLHIALPSDRGYFIRPYIKLNGQQKGYMWQGGQRGLWRQFLACNVRDFTIANTRK